MNRGQLAALLFQTFTKWQKQDATLRAAALTFFTIMPLPSLALIAVAVLAQVYGQQGAMQQLTAQVSSFAGPTIANLLSELLLNAQSPLTGGLGSFLAVVFAFAGLLGAFSVLQKSIDTVWEIQAEARGRTAFIKEKTLPFMLIIAIGAIVVGWTAISTVLFGAVVFFLNPVLGIFTPYLIRILEIVLSFGLGTLLFAIIFMELPETKIEWRDVWPASILTAGIFTALNYFFGLYLSLVQVTTLAGTAGSLIVLFLWIYIVNLFILFGAQFSKVYAQAFGSHHNKLPVLKWPPRPKLDRVEVKAEVSIKVSKQKSARQ
jgi:membrane protein